MAKRPRYYNQYGGGPEQKSTGFSSDQIRWFLIRIAIPGMVIGALAIVVFHYWATGMLGF